MWDIYVFQLLEVSFYEWPVVVWCIMAIVNVTWGVGVYYLMILTITLNEIWKGYKWDWLCFIINVKYTMLKGL
jgi:hypothetical protein